MNDSKWCCVLDDNNGYVVRTCSHDVAASTDDAGLWHLWGLHIEDKGRTLKQGQAYLGQPCQFRVNKTSICPCWRAISWCISKVLGLQVFRLLATFLFFGVLSNSPWHPRVIIVFSSLFLRSDYEYCTLFEPGNYAHFLEMSPSPFLRWALGINVIITASIFSLRHTLVFTRVTRLSAKKLFIIRSQYNTDESHFSSRNRICHMCMNVMLPQRWHYFPHRIPFAVNWLFTGAHSCFPGFYVLLLPCIFDI